MRSPAADAIATAGHDNAQPPDRRDQLTEVGGEGDQFPNCQICFR